jgi:hypothetical protein
MLCQNSLYVLPQEKMVSYLDKKTILKIMMEVVCEWPLEGRLFVEDKLE